MADVKPQRQMLIPLFLSKWQTLLPIFLWHVVGTRIHVIAFEGGRCHCPVADGKATFSFVFEDGRYYCQVADGIATMY